MDQGELRIVPVTDPADIPELAHLFTLSLKGSSFEAFIEKYGKKNVYDDAVDKIGSSLKDENHHTFKALLSTKTAEGEQLEKVVGLAQWFFGYIVLPKTDPFASTQAVSKDKDPTIPVTATDVAVESTGNASVEWLNTEDGSATPDPYTEHVRKMSNVYIGTIRGKKHVCKYDSPRLINLSDIECRYPTYHNQKKKKAKRYRAEIDPMGC